VRLRHHAGTGLSFDNLGEVTALARGEWPAGKPVGHHWSVTRALPRLLGLLDEFGLRATFFVEGLNAELYPDALRELDAAGHEVAFHGWEHEPWGGLEPERERALFARGVEAFCALGLRPAGFRPPGGELTEATIPLLREFGFEYCSPAASTPRSPGHTLDERDGIAIVPFRWELVDAWYYLPGFAGPPSAAALRDAVMRALDAGGYTTLLFHPFLTEPEERLAVLREVLERARDAVPLRDVVKAGGSAPT
jgi:peptidoglycan/xylan/chitin deacetylase (PgdA/CDA1 family)